MRVSSVVSGFAVTLFVSANARANCQIVAYSFADYGYEPSTYSYIHFGADARQTNEAIVGRFWEQGFRGSSNEGTYDDSQWLTAEPGFDKWDFQGFLGTHGVFGCVQGEMVLVLQDTTLDDSDAVFVAGRVRFDGYTVHEFPFWVTGLEWNAVKFPTACREHQKRQGTTVTVDLALDDIPGGFYGEPGMLRQDTITGYTIWVAHGDADPGRSPAAWTLQTTVPYTGVPGVLSGLQVDCSAPGDVFIAVGLEFDHGQFTSDFVGKPTRIACERLAFDPTDPDADGTETRCDNCPLDPDLGPKAIKLVGPKTTLQRLQRCRDLVSVTGR